MANKVWIEFQARLDKARASIKSFFTWVQTQKDNIENITFKTNSEKLLDVKKKINSLTWDIAILKGQIKEVNLEALTNPSSLSKIPELTNKLTKAKNELAEFRIESKKLQDQDMPWYFNKLWTNIGNTIKRIGLFTLAFTAINQTKNLIASSVNNAIEFESALAWVNKTLDITASELKWLDTELKKLSTQIPLTYVELAKIAEIGWQLWVPKEQIIQFTETMAQLQATTNLTSEEAIINFAKFNNVLWITWDEIWKVGSVLVELGNNSATTESQILTFGRRIAASWKLAWLSAWEVLAIGAAFSSAWIEAESGWTAVQKVLLSITQAVKEWWKNLDLYAAVSWKTSSEFAEYWKNDAWNAFADFVTWLKNAWDDSFDILAQLWEDNVRTVRAFLATANSWQELKTAIQLANNEFANWDALLVEFNKRAETTASKLAMQKNEWKLLWAEIANWTLPILVDTQWVLINVTKEVVWLFSNLKTLISDIVTTTKESELLKTWFVLLLSAIAVLAWPIWIFILSLGAIATAMIKTENWTKTLTTFIKALWISLLALLWPIWVATWAILALASAYASLKANKELYEQWFVNTNKQQEAVSKSITESADKLKKINEDSLELSKSNTKESQKQIILNDKLAQIEAAKISALKISRDLAWWDKTQEQVAKLNQEFQNQKWIIDSLKWEYNELAWVKAEIITTNSEIVESDKELYKDLIWWAWWSAGKIKDIEDELSKQIEKDLEKRLSIKEKYWQQDLKTSTDFTLQEYKDLLKINEARLKEELSQLDNYSWDELEIREKIIQRLSDDIKDYSSLINKETKKQEDDITDLYKTIWDEADNAADSVQGLYDDIKRINDLWKDKETKLAEARVEAEKEITDLKAEQLRLEEKFRWIENLKWITITWNAEDNDFGWWIKWSDIKEYQELLEKIAEQNKIVAETEWLISEWILTKVTNYENATKVWKILLDNNEKESELLEKLNEQYETNYETISELSDWLTTKLWEEETELNRIRKAQELLEIQYTWILWEQYKTREEYIQSLIIKTRDLINAQRELNALSWTANPDLSSVVPASSEQTINYNIIINESNNSKDTARAVVNATNIANKKSTPSSNS